jgi:hypothetical protein
MALPAVAMAMAPAAAGIIVGLVGVLTAAADAPTQSSSRDLIIFGIIAFFTSITAPLILSYRIQAHRRAERLDDRKYEESRENKRQAAAEEVAARAAIAAKDLAESQKRIADQAAEAARLLVANNIRIEAAEKEQMAKLVQIDLQAKRIHTLVNSDMTAARQSELDQTRAIVTVLKRVIAMDESRHIEPDEKDVLALAAAERRVSDLEAILADRMNQMREVEAEANIQKAAGGTQLDENNN